MKTIKQLEKEIERSSGVENTDVEEAKLQTLKEVLKLIEKLAENSSYGAGWCPVEKLKKQIQGKWIIDV